MKYRDPHRPCDNLDNSQIQVRNSSDIEVHKLVGATFITSTVKSQGNRKIISGIVQNHFLQIMPFFQFSSNYKIMGSFKKDS